MNNYCNFCEDKTKVDKSGRWVCPNGHFIVKGDKVEIIQPKSTGSFEGVNVYRLNHIKGEFCNSPNIKGDFCDDVGKLKDEPLSDIKNTKV